MVSGKEIITGGVPALMNPSPGSGIFIKIAFEFK